MEYDEELDKMVCEDDDCGMLVDVEDRQLPSDAQRTADKKRYRGDE
jgi:hypothetical protein